ncbi:MAG: iron-sulfur cluster assembly scaffold protein [Planctomycetota bacterium]|jgi:nitrogen fixation NifU-like protein
MAEVYAAAFLDHFQNPRGVGVLAEATHRGEAEDSACGDRLWLDLTVHDGVIREARFRVEGCPGAIAVGSALTTLLPGRPASTDAVGPEEITRLLGGVPPAKRHALRLARSALRAAFA